MRAALLDLGISDIAIQTESRGAADLAVKTTKGEARNRRVEVRFETSTLFRGALSKGLSLTPPSGPTGATSTGSGQSGVTDISKLCEKNPTLCYGSGKGSSIFQPIPYDAYERMDLVGVGRERGDLSQMWAQLYWKYRRLGLSEDLAAKAANKELSATSEKEQSRNNPSAADRLDTEMKQAYPNATTVGPGSIELFRF